MNWRTGMEKEHSHLGASPCKTLLGTPSLGSWPIRMGKQQYGSLKDVRHFNFIKRLYIIPDYFYFAINCMLPAFYKWRDLKIPAPQNPENRTRPVDFACNLLMNDSASNLILKLKMATKNWPLSSDLQIISIVKNH